MSVSSTSFVRTPYPPLCGPPSPCGEGLDGATLRVDFYKGRCPKVCDGRFPSYRQPSPRGEGAPKGRIGHRRHERERGECVSSTSFMRAPYPPLCGPPSPCGEGLDGATLRADFCKRRCPKVCDGRFPSYRQPSPCREGLGGATLRVDFCKRRCPKVAFKSLVTVPQDTFLYYSTGDE